MLWYGIRSIIKIICTISQIVNNGEIVQSAKETAQIFNNYFVNVAGKVESEIPRTKQIHLTILGENLMHHFFFFSQIHLR